jgi:putative heme-binding domain-containing protein
VLPAAAAWLEVNSSDAAADRLACEVLWLQQSFHAVDGALLRQVLGAATPEARAAATHVLADERLRLEGAESLLVTQSLDPHPRVRTDALRGLSFFPTPTAIAAVVAAANADPSDRFLSYTADAALGANVDVWRGQHLKGELAARGSPAAGILDSVIALDKKAAEVVPYLQILLSREPGPEEQRSKAIQAIADVKGGDAGNGQAVFRRLCISCHKVGDVGADFGPEMSKVGERLTGPKLVQSIIDPNADIAEKYLSTSVLTHEGTSITGLVVSETPETLVIFDGKEQKSIPVAEIDERTVLRQSSMPEGLAGTLSPTEFLDVIEYMRQLK